uniref:Uncharacterized protein n=1 Tax=Prymnesium polylepis TaxID=72548 RepID=A0A7S4HVD2_9EUKA|mmetsp:Transcript_22971/g.56743  ORF Transcript_22971/g.56743 Transcript_22971/m.56743 type:complete len:122 (+) Transcript_22971:234-599(+)
MALSLPATPRGPLLGVDRCVEPHPTCTARAQGIPSRKVPNKKRNKKVRQEGGCRVRQRRGRAPTTRPPPIDARAPHTAPAALAAPALAHASSCLRRGARTRECGRAHRSGCDLKPVDPTVD